MARITLLRSSGDTTDGLASSVSLFPTNRFLVRRSIIGRRGNVTIAVAETMCCGHDVRRYSVRSPTSRLQSYFTGADLRPSQLFLLLLAALFVAETQAALIKLPPLPPPKWFYNGTYASPSCKTTFRCDTSSRNFTVPACSCHPNCSLYDACCEDVRPSDWSRRVLPSDAYECAIYPELVFDTKGSLLINGVAFVFVITKCPSTYGVSYVAKLCRAPFGSSTNDSQHVPWVTDKITGITYSNQFCALCYNVAAESMVFWNTTYNCVTDSDIHIFDRFRLAGCKHNVLTTDAIFSLIPTCRGPYQASCANGASQQTVEACTNSPARYIYDSVNFVTYRNYNCSLCDSQMEPDNRRYGCLSYPTSLEWTVAADLRNELHTESCPQKISTFATRKEQIVFSMLCPDTEFDTEGCSETVGKTALIAMYGGDGAREYRITSAGLRLLLNDTYSVCYRCQPHAAYSYSLLSQNATLLVNDVIYPKPFFQLEDNGSVTVCYAPAGLVRSLPSISGSERSSEVSVALMALRLLGIAMHVDEWAVLRLPL